MATGVYVSVIALQKRGTNVAARRILNPITGNVRNAETDSGSRPVDGFLHISFNTGRQDFEVVGPSQNERQDI